MDLVGRALLTYLLHSTLLLGAAALVGLVLRGRRLALQEALLRAALVGGFLTAGLQLGLGLDPLGGTVHVPALAGSGETAAGAVPASPGPARTAGRVALVPRWETRVILGPTAPPWLAPRWPLALASAWALLAAGSLVRLGVAARRLRDLLHGRRPLRVLDVAPEAEAIGRALGLHGPLRVSSAPRLSVPLATGVLRPEVCLPPRAVSELGQDERLALCAHEIAHLARRDPLWILVARLVECVAPVQPLNGWARRRLQDLAECLSDDLAVSASGRPLGLARSLVDVASWTLGEPALVPAVAAGALSARSRLGHRVERLMDSRRPLERPRRALLPVAGLAVLATALVTPVVSGSPPPPRPSDDPRAGDERRLEELSRRLAARVQAHEAEMRELERQVEVLASRARPNEAEIDRLSRGIAAAAAELAAAVATDFEAGGAARRSDRTADAARRVAELQAQLRATTREIEIPEAELRALTDKARAVAEASRPTAAETQELRQLSERMAREAAERVRDEVKRAADEMRRAAEEMRRAAEEKEREAPPKP